MRYCDELIRHAASIGRQDRLAFRLRRYEMLRRWLEVGNASQVSREFGITPAWGGDLIYKARRDFVLSDKTGELTMGSPAERFLEVVKEGIREVEGLIAARGGVMRKKLTKKEERESRHRAELDLYADLGELG